MPPLLESLAGSYAVVAIVSGRPGRHVRDLLGASRAEVFGLYGLEGTEAPAEPVRAAIADVRRAAGEVDGTRVEDKQLSLAVHFRSSRDPDRARSHLGPLLAEVAERHGLRLLPGKMVIELALAQTPGKGTVVLAEARARRLRACLYAGDDTADLEAFTALDELSGQGIATAKVAVRSAEAPEELVRSADVVVEGPAGLVRLLAELV